MRSTFAIIAKEMDEICHWLQSFGLNSNLSRASDYRKRLNEIKRAFDENDFDPVNSQAAPYLKALIEFQDLSTIYRSLRGHEPQGLLERLKKVNSGPVTYSDENDSNSAARNFAFELLVASSISTANLPCILNASLADVRTKIGGRPINIQCKRLRSANRVHKNVKKACKQLIIDCKPKRGNRPLGYVFLDITALLNPQSSTFDADNEKSIIDFNNFIIEHFYKEHIDTYDEGYPHCLLGIVVHNTILSYDRNDGSYGAYRGLMFWDRPGLDHKRKKLSNSLLSRINASVQCR